MKILLNLIFLPNRFFSFLSPDFNFSTREISFKNLLQSLQKVNYNVENQQLKAFFIMSGFKIVFFKFMELVIVNKQLVDLTLKRNTFRLFV